MRRLFISYARENKRDVDELVEHLGLMGYETWVDFRLRGGQDWWDEILRRIANSDIFVAVLSHAALSSTACRREFDWAESLDRPVLPVAVEPLPPALPRRFARRQIIDYSQPTQRQRAALMLQGGIGSVPSAPPLPDPLPEPPTAPLSYLTDLIDVITQPDAIAYARQHGLLQQLAGALRSVDPEERRGGKDILERFAGRTDLDPDIELAIADLREKTHESLIAAPDAKPAETVSTAVERSGPESSQEASIPAIRLDQLAGSSDENIPAPKPKPRGNRRRRMVFGAGAVIIVSIVLSLVMVFVRPFSDPAKPGQGKVAEIAGLVPVAIQQSGKLIVGVDSTYPPLEFKEIKNDNVELIGADVDLMNAVGVILGLKIDFRESNFDKIIPQIGGGGDYDVGMSSFVDNKAREEREKIDFIDYLRSGDLWARRPGSSINPADACGKKVAVQTATEMADRLLQASDSCTVEGEPEIDIMKFDGEPNVEDAVISGKADAMAAHYPVTTYAISRSGGRLEAAGEFIRNGLIGWIVQKGSPLAQALLKALEHLISTGDYDKILSKWNMNLAGIRTQSINGATQ